MIMNEDNDNCKTVIMVYFNRSTEWLFSVKLHYWKLKQFIIIEVTNENIRGYSRKKQC